MCRTILSAALVVATVAAAQAQPFTVWEDGGWIWARNEATGAQRCISTVGACSQPVTAGWWAAWVDPRLQQSWIYAIYGCRLDQQWEGNVDPTPNAPVVTAFSPVTDPRLSQVGTRWIWEHWIAWRQEGGVWAHYFEDGWDASFEVLPDYSDWFELEGATIRYAGGEVELVPHAPPVPEPGTMILAVSAALCGLAWICRRTHCRCPDSTQI
jgi:hypothetical protein